MCRCGGWSPQRQCPVSRNCKHGERGCYSGPHSSLRVPSNNGASPLWQARSPSTYTFGHGCTTLQPLQAISVQPTPGLSLGFSNQSPPVSKDVRLTLGSTRQQHNQCVQVSLCLASQLMHYPPRFQSSPSVLANLHTSEGASQNAGTCPLSQLPPRRYRSHSNSFLSFFFF